MVFVTSPTWKIRQSRAVNSPSPAGMSQHKAWDWNSAILNSLCQPRPRAHLWCPSICLLPLLLTWGEQPYLVCLDKVEVFPMDPKAMFKISTFFLAPGTKLICSRKKELVEMCRIWKELHLP